MYCCGPTVYGLLHIGNFRGAVFYNFTRLWLERLGFKVKFCYNFTDVDDKIIAKAGEENLAPQDISKKYIKEFYKDFKSLALKPHDDNPKATEYIEDMIRWIQNLIENNKAYEKDGHVFFSVKNFKRYGRLSRFKAKELEARALELELPKKAKADFALWKKSKPGELSWESPWGKGRPGWHIECTVMSEKCLNGSLDIHGGGVDLIFPHHENEIAQFEGIKNEPFVKYWLHHNMFEFGGRKISKSLNAPQTMRSFLQEYNAEIFKYMVLNVHYRSTAEVSLGTILQACSSLSRIYQTLKTAKQFVEKNSPSADEKKDKEFLEQIRRSRREAETALNDDLNTAKALAVCFSLVRVFNDLFMQKQKSSACCYSFSAELILNFFKDYGELFSLFQEEPENFLNELDGIFLKKANLSRSEVNSALKERAEARRKKDFKQADALRERLEKKGVSIQDTPQGVKWRMDPSYFSKEEP